jgi:hypothetical protein
MAACSASPCDQACLDRLALRVRERIARPSRDDLPNHAIVTLPPDLHRTDCQMDGIIGGTGTPGEVHPAARRSAPWGLSAGQAPRPRPSTAAWVTCHHSAKATRLL